MKTELEDLNSQINNIKNNGEGNQENSEKNNIQNEIEKARNDLESLKQTSSTNQSDIHKL